MNFTLRPTHSPFSGQAAKQTMSLMHQSAPLLKATLLQNNSIQPQAADSIHFGHAGHDHAHDAAHKSAPAPMMKDYSNPFVFLKDFFTNLWKNLYLIIPFLKPPASKPTEAPGTGEIAHNHSTHTGHKHDDHVHTAACNHGPASSHTHHTDEAEPEETPPPSLGKAFTGWWKEMGRITREDAQKLVADKPPEPHDHNHSDHRHHHYHAH